MISPLLSIAKAVPVFPLVIDQDKAISSSPVASTSTTESPLDAVSWTLPDVSVTVIPSLVTEMVTASMSDSSPLAAKTWSVYDDSVS